MSFKENIINWIKAIALSISVFIGLIIYHKFIFKKDKDKEEVQKSLDVLTDAITNGIKEGEKIDTIINEAKDIINDSKKEKEQIIESNGKDRKEKAEKSGFKKV